jgi:hypothetical protein
MTRRSETADDRCGQRASWVVRVSRLSDQAGDDLSECTTPVQRLEMMWPLATEAWSLSGRPLPEYERCEIPVRVVADGFSESGPSS